MSSLNLEGWKKQLFRISRSQGTVEAAEKGYEVFREFLNETKRPDPEELISEVKSGRIDVYHLLDEFVGYLDDKGLSPRTVRNRFYAATSLLRYHDVEIDKERLKEKVRLPKAKKVREQPVKIEELRTLVNAAGPAVRALILTLVSSGMRISETAALRVRDLDFTSFPPIVVINLRAETTKTDEDRTVFASDEAAEALKAITIGKTPDHLVFFRDRTVSKPKDANKLRTYYTRLLKKVAFDRKIEGHSYYALHFHRLRKLFYSTMQANDALGRDAADALLGHKGLQQVYYSSPLEKRATEFKKHMDKLYVVTVVSKVDAFETAVTATMARTGKSRDEVVRELKEYEDDHLRLKGERLDWNKWQIAHLIKDEEKKPEKKELHDPQIVIDESELTRHLAEGWFFVATLPSGKIVVGRYE